MYSTYSVIITSRYDHMLTSTRQTRLSLSSLPPPKLLRLIASKKLEGKTVE